MWTNISLTRDPWATSLSWENSLIQLTYMIILMLIERRKNPFLLSANWMVLHLNKLEFPSLKDNLRQIGWNWPSGSEERFSNFVNVCLLCSNYIPLEKDGPFIWTNLNPLFVKFVKLLVDWNWPGGSWEDFFLIS